MDGDTGNQEYKVVFEFANDEDNADIVKYAYDKVKTARASAIIGSVTENTAQTLNDMAKKDNLLVITPSATGKLDAETTNSFRMCLSKEQQGEVMADYAFNKANVKKMAILYPDSDTNAKAIVDSFIKSYEKAGGSVVLCEIYDNTTENVLDNIQVSLESVVNSEINMIFAPVDSREATNICKVMQEQNYKFSIIGCDGWQSMVSTIEDNTVIDGIVFFSQFANSSNSEAVSSFIKEYKAAYIEEPDMYAANAYDSVFAIVKAAEDMQSIDSKEIIAGIKNIEFDGITGTSINFEYNGENGKSVELLKIKNGRNVPLDI